jgi:hypothetical protein
VKVISVQRCKEYEDETEEVVETMLFEIIFGKLPHILPPQRYSSTYAAGQHLKVYRLALSALMTHLNK